MKQKKKNDIAALLDYAGSHRGLTFLGLGLSAASMVCSMIPYLCIWLAARDLIEVAPNWTQAQSVARYGWLAFGAAFGGIVLYFGGLMCTHLAAFRTAANIRKQGVAHVMNAPLGWFDANASGLIRGRLDAAAADTETLLAHNLADIVGTITLFIAMLVLMFVFDWRMGCACLLAAVISILTMFAMMGGKNAQIMAEYQAAQDRMTKAGTEYVRGIPVVKIFQQTVYSFKAFQQAIEEYSAKAEHYQADVCRTPQSINLSVTEGAFVFLVPAALFLAPGALATGSFAGFVTDFAFYAVFSAIISTALARIMFASSGIMLAGTALGRIRMVMEYCHYYLPRIADQETVNHICTEVDKWMNLNTYTPKPIQRPFTKDINNIPLRHFVWNISERFLYKRYYNGDNRAKFIKALFPKSFADTDLSTIKNFKVEPLKTEIPIDEPENGKLDFHYPEDYVRN